jgi:hypothetical protein
MKNILKKNRNHTLKYNVKSNVSTAVYIFFPAYKKNYVRNLVSCLQSLKNDSSLFW